MPISFERVKTYLNKIAEQSPIPIETSPHGKFWDVDYAAFMSGTLPSIQCKAKPVPLAPHNQADQSVVVDPLRWPLFLVLALQDPASYCAKPQMPAGGPFITDPSYSIEVDGVRISGAQIRQDIQDWIEAGAPEGAALVG